MQKHFCKRLNPDGIQKDVQNTAWVERVWNMEHLKNLQSVFLKH